MWINATKDLSVFLPDTDRGAARTSVDVSSIGLPRLFDNPTSAAIALGHWFNGPYKGVMEGDEDGLNVYYDVQTDPNRRIIWGERLSPREVKICLT